MTRFVKTRKTYPDTTYSILQVSDLSTMTEDSPKRARWGSMDTYKSKTAKVTPDKDRKAGERIISMGQWDDRSRPGLWLTVDINGTSFPINQANPLLSRPEHDLVIGNGYWDIGWSTNKKIHIAKTYNAGTAMKIAEAVVAHCTDLTFRIDLSNGKWPSSDAMLIWNNALGMLALVGMDIFENKLKQILPDVEIEKPPNAISWADNQTGLLITNYSNEQIEEHT